MVVRLQISPVEAKETGKMACEKLNVPCQGVKSEVFPGMSITCELPVVAGMILTADDCRGLDPRTDLLWVGLSRKEEGQLRTDPRNNRGAILIGFSRVQSGQPTWNKVLRWLYVSYVSPFTPATLVQI